MAKKAKARAVDPRENELLDAVFADPSDDAARLVYADWLSERGDKRGEFIQIQVERQRGTPRWLKYMKRESELQQRYSRLWVESVRPFVEKNGAGWVWSRGFLWFVRVKGEAFVKGAEAFLSASPDLEVSLHDG